MSLIIAEYKIPWYASVEIMEVFYALLHETREMHVWIKETLKEKQEVMQVPQEMS